MSSEMCYDWNCQVVETEGIEPSQADAKPGRNRTSGVPTMVATTGVEPARA